MKHSGRLTSSITRLTWRSRLFKQRPRWQKAAGISTIASSPFSNDANAISPRQHSRARWCHSVAASESVLSDYVYYPEADLEFFEVYDTGGYHPILIGDTFQDGRYHVVHKLGFGGYSTIWLARDRKLKRHVSLKVIIANESSSCTEGKILRLLHDTDSAHPGKRFIPRLLDEFSFDGPNGRHTCLVQEPAGCNVAVSKEEAPNFMFPIESARSIAAQLIMGLSYLHSRGVCHGDLHLRNFLLCGPNLDKLSPDELYERYRLDKCPIKRMDGTPLGPQAPSYAVYPMYIKMAANRVVDPIVKISDYGTSFIPTATSSPELHTPSLYLPPEDTFNEPITLAADIWTLGVSLYEVLGERPLFESIFGDRDDILADTVSTLGRPPARWWDKWENRKEFFNPDGSFISNIKRVYSPVFRPLHQRMWGMGRGKTPGTCEWDVAAGEMRALEDLLRAMLAYEPSERPTAEQLMASEYMIEWAMPAWERQLRAM